MTRPFAALAAWLVAAQALAHHSLAAFDMRTQRVIEGIVTEYYFANPHVYVTLRQTADDDEPRIWELEGLAATVMARHGWTRSTLAIGDAVKAHVFPSRDPASGRAMLWAIERSGTVLFDTVRDVFETTSPAPRTHRTDSLAGTWSILVSPSNRRLFLGEVPSANDDAPPTSVPLSDVLPLTARAALAIERYDTQTMDPAFDCIAPTAPRSMVIGESWSIEIRDDAVLLREPRGSVRTIHLDATSHGDTDVTVQGHSIGAWDGAALTVETTRFAEHVHGNAVPVPSGAQKHVRERFELDAGGASLTYRFELRDPDYLVAPVTGEAQWAYIGDDEPTVIECELESARRFRRN